MKPKHQVNNGCIPYRSPAASYERLITVMIALLYYPLINLSEHAIFQSPKSISVCDNEYSAITPISRLGLI